MKMVSPEGTSQLSLRINFLPKKMVWEQKNDKDD